MTIHTLHKEGAKMANTQRRSSKKRLRVMHTWDTEQIIGLIEMVAIDVHYPRVNWDDIAAFHNEKFLKGSDGRSPKAVEGMFSRIRDGFMYLQDERMMTLMVEHERLWQRVSRRSKRCDEVDALRSQVEEQSRQINQLLEALARQAPQHIAEPAQSIMSI